MVVPCVVAATMNHKCAFELPAKLVKLRNCRDLFASSDLCVDLLIMLLCCQFVVVNVVYCASPVDLLGLAWCRRMPVEVELEVCT